MVHDKAAGQVKSPHQSHHFGIHLIHSVTMELCFNVTESVKYNDKNIDKKSDCIMFHAYTIDAMTSLLKILHSRCSDHICCIVSVTSSYPMNSVKTGGEKGCWELHDFPTSSDPHSHGSWDKSKNPYPLGNCIIPNSATTGAPGTMRPVVCGLMVAGASAVVEFGIMRFLNRYGFLLYCQT